MLRFVYLGVVGAMLAAGAGCRTSNGSCCQTNPPPTPRTVVVPPPPAPALAPVGYYPQQPSPGYAPPPPQPAPPGLPPGAVLTPPPGARIIQPGQQAGQPPGLPPMQQPTTTNAPPAEPPLLPPAQPRSDPQWKPIEGRDLPPRVEPSRDAPPRVNLYAPEPVDTPKDPASLEPPVLEKSRKSNEEPPLKRPSVQGNLPPIRQFEVVKDNVFAGLRPPLDGLDWLQATGVRTVVHIHLPNQDDSADRTQVEKRNMRYVAFEVSPQTLTREKATEFVKLIREGAKQSIFVYDQDGSLAGSMWYLHLRLGEILDDDAARIRASRLGLDSERPGQHREMWLAVQKVLAEIR